MGENVGNEKTPENILMVYGLFNAFKIIFNTKNLIKNLLKKYSRKKFRNVKRVRYLLSHFLKNLPNNK